MMKELEEFLEKQKDLNLKMLQDMLQSQSLIQHNLTIGLDSLKKCIDNIPAKLILKQGLYSRVTINRQMQHQHILNLLGNKNYLGSLNVEEEQKEIYRERMFNIPFTITDMKGQIIEDQDFSVSLKVYTSEKFPKEVYTNIKGKPIIKGQTTMNVKARGEFQRISITEVSSHYPSGKFIIVVYSDQQFLRPFIMDQIIVKAKKLLK